MYRLLIIILVSLLSKNATALTVANSNIHNKTTIMKTNTKVQKEIFKSVKGYKGKYEVSNLGRVKSLNSRWGKTIILKTYVTRNGYCGIGLNSDSKTISRKVHQLVAESFLNHVPCGHKLVVNHINFDKQDNRAENLEVVTTRENTNQKHLKSTSKYVGVTWHKRDKRWQSSIRLNGKKEYLGYFKSEYDAHLAYENKLKQINE